MQLLNKNTDYAVRALIVVAMSDNQWVSSREISAEQEIPLQYVRRILQDLVRGEYLESKEGAQGGVRLNKEPSEISLVDVIKLCQGNVQLSECMFRKKLCPKRAVCVLRRRIGMIEQKVVDEFKDITLKTLIDDIQEG